GHGAVASLGGGVCRVSCFGATDRAGRSQLSPTACAVSKNRPSSPEPHGGQFFSRLFRAGFSLEQQPRPSQVLHLSRQDNGVTLRARTIQKAHGPAPFFESHSNFICRRI